MRKLTQNGSHLLVIALVLVAVGVVGIAGYTVMKANNPDTAKTSSEAAAPNATDLKTADDSLDSSASDLDTSLDESNLDADLNSML